LEVATVQFAGQLPAQARTGDMPLHRAPHLARVEWLLHVVVGLMAHGVLRGVEGGVAGEHDHRNVGIQAADFAQPFETAAAWHANIEDDGVRFMFAQQFQAAGNAVGAQHAVFVFEQEAQAFAGTEFVVDYEHDRHGIDVRHGSPLVRIRNRGYT